MLVPLLVYILLLPLPYGLINSVIITGQLRNFSSAYSRHLRPVYWRTTITAARSLWQRGRLFTLQ